LPSWGIISLSRRTFPQEHNSLQTYLYQTEDLGELCTYEDNIKIKS
jgi:hypothetical protein